METYVYEVTFNFVFEVRMSCDNHKETVIVAVPAAVVSGVVFFVVGIILGW